MRWLSGDRRAERIERRGEKRSARITERADRARAARVRNGSRTPFRSSTFVTGRRRGR